MSFTIRPATAEDADFVLALIARPWVRANVGGPGPGTREIYLQALAHSDGCVNIIARDGSPFGICAYKITDAWVMKLSAVAFEQPRTGAGLFTLTWLLRRAFEELAVHRIYLYVQEDNRGAQALYERVGFRREGCFRDGYRTVDGGNANLLAYGLLATDVKSR